MAERRSRRRPRSWIGFLLTACVLGAIAVPATGITIVSADRSLDVRATFTLPDASGQAGAGSFVDSLSVTGRNSTGARNTGRASQDTSITLAGDTLTITGSGSASGTSSRSGSATGGVSLSVDFILGSAGTYQLTQGAVTAGGSGDHSANPRMFLEDVATGTRIFDLFAGNPGPVDLNGLLAAGTTYRFTAFLNASSFGSGPFSSNGFATFDLGSFVVVPEPSALGLLLLAGATVGCSRARPRA